jgi:hypothetical protein
MHQYQIIVGNVGTVENTTNGFLALRQYGMWKTEVEKETGRASGETVTLIRDGEPLHEFDPTAGYFMVEVTDTFGGEANYCWIRRYKIKARTERGAMCKVPGYSWRKEYEGRYNALGACVCAFIDSFDPSDERIGTDYETL